MITFSLALFYLNAKLFILLFRFIIFHSAASARADPYRPITCLKPPLIGYLGLFPCLSASKNKTFSFRRGDCQSFFALGWTAENTFVMFLKISEGSSEFTNRVDTGSVWTSAAGSFKRGLL